MPVIIVGEIIQWKTTSSYQSHLLHHSACLSCRIGKDSHLLKCCYCLSNSDRQDCSRWHCCPVHGSWWHFQGWSPACRIERSSSVCPVQRLIVSIESEGKAVEFSFCCWWMGLMNFLKLFWTHYAECDEEIEMHFMLLEEFHENDALNDWKY